MNFIKGIMVGGLITTGMFILYTESGMNANTMKKKGKKMIKKIGII